MKIVNITQGSPEWHAFRATHYNASDAPAMMGCSLHETRDELIERLATGITKEIDPATQRRFDEGHRLEALGRKWVGDFCGEEFFPLVYESGKYGASLDGQTMDGTLNFEHKTMNAALRDALEKDEPLHDAYTVQMEHQMMVSGAGETVFVAGHEVQDENGVIEYKCAHRRITASMALRARIIAGWEQLEKDVEARKAQIAAGIEKPKHEKLKGAAPESAMALVLQVSGSVVACNVPEFKAHAIAKIEAINRTLITDQDFADAEESVKWCTEVELRIKQVKDSAIAQQATIEQAFRALDDVAELVRCTRLNLKPKIDAEKLARRAEIVRKAGEALSAHIQSLGVRYMPSIPADFAGVMKGLKTIASCESKANDELARAKIEANQMAARIAANLAVLEPVRGFSSLFPDVAALVLHEPATFEAHVNSRIAKHREAIAAQVEAERASAEARAERARKQAEADAAMQAERVQQVATAAAREAQHVNTMAQFSTPQPVKSDAPSLTLASIQNRLGLAITHGNLAALGFQTSTIAFEHDVYQNDQFGFICDDIVRRVQWAKATWLAEQHSL